MSGGEMGWVVQGDHLQLIIFKMKKAFGAEFG